MIALLWALWGCTTPPPLAERERRPDVLLITLDTTRADRIGAYGYADAHTEHLDALAARGRRYDSAWSPLPLTIPAHASLMTGRYPAHHGVRANGDAWLPAEERLLAEAFRDGGYATMASVGAFVTTREWGFGQGFQQYSEEVPRDLDFWHAEREGAAVVDDLVRALAERDPDRPVFAWVHLYDAHQPFAAGEPWLSECDGRPYDAEIAYVDDQVGRLLEAFDQERTLVAVVADHGEGLGEHGELAHGLFVYAGTTRVPWILAGPGIGSEVVDQPVSLVDVAPTLLAAAGLPALKRVDGRVVPGDPAPVHLESWQLDQRFGVAPHLAVIADGYTLIDLPRPELYRLEDRAQTEDLASAEPERVAALQALRKGADFDPPSADATHPASPAVSRQLEALGYVEGGFLGDPTAPRPDPKDRGEMLALVQIHELQIQEGRAAEAEATVRKLAADDPDVVEFQLKLARVQVARGELDQARAAIEALVERDPTNAIAVHLLGSILASQGEFQLAADRFQAASERMPYAPRLRAMAVAALFESPGGGRAGFELARTMLQEHPKDSAVAGLLGVHLVRNGQIEAALPLLQLGNSAEVPERDVSYLLAAAATGRGAEAEAKQLLDRELEHHPGHVRALMARLKIEGTHGDWQGQVDRVEAWLAGPGRAHLERKPPDVALADVIAVQAQALFNLGRHPEARQALDAGLAVDPDRANLLLLDANLLHQEGRDEAARARFEQAQAARLRELSEGASTGD